MAGQKIRIRLKAYDHEAIDASARKIVETVTRTGARIVGPVPLPTEKNVYCVIRSPHKYRIRASTSRCVPTSGDRHSRPHAQDRGRAHAHRPACQRRRQHPVTSDRVAVSKQRAAETVNR